MSLILGVKTILDNVFGSLVVSLFPRCAFNFLGVLLVLREAMGSSDHGVIWEARTTELSI